MTRPEHFTRGGALPDSWPRKRRSLFCVLGFHWRYRDPFWEGEGVRWVCRCGDVFHRVDDFAGY